jgi:peptide/nickel transport system ATP-binding protein
VPDPKHHLDFKRLMEGRASDPTAWPEPFRRVPGRPAQLIDVAPGHCVETSAMADLMREREVTLAGGS